MKINNEEYKILDVSKIHTVPDCIVVAPNKLGTGHGEAKFYFGSIAGKDFFDTGTQAINCFFLKADFIAYLDAVKKEYMFPSHNYAEKENLPKLWSKRFNLISEQPDMISFTVKVQSQIQGPRGYLNSRDKGYKLFRTISLPLVSYFSIMRLLSPTGDVLFYWKLFVDFNALQQRGIDPLVFAYGHKRKGKTKGCPIPQEDGTKSKRDAAEQARYREKLLEDCPCCPITRISDERLLIASHIKPFSVSEDKEAFDPKNGFILSPLYDRLFDQGFISFDEKKRMMVSNWLSPSNQKCCNIKDGTFIQMLPIDDDREKYLQYHRKYVFKG